MPDVLPDSRARVPRGLVAAPGGTWVPIFCANCGADGGLVPEENCTFAFYLCQGCADRWGPLAGTMLVPDELYWSKVAEEQAAAGGAEDTPALALLARESPYR